VEPAVFDAQRLAAVERTGLLDSAASESFDSLTCLAARLLHAPMAFLTLVDDRRSFWLSTDGVAEGRENPVEESFCQYVIADGAALVIGDATADTRVCNNPSVGLLGVRAWAGFPVFDADGVPLGSFCVMDTVVRAWTKQDVHVLSVLSQAASAQIALLAAVGAELRAREDLEAVRASEQQAEQRLQRLASVTLELVAADTVEGLTEIVIDHALPVLGVDGGGVVLRESDRMRVVVSGRLDARVQLIYGELPLNSPLPACHVARTGQRLVLANRAQGLAFLPQMADVYADTQRLAWAFCPLRVADRLLGSLAVCWIEERDTIPDAELDLIDAFAAQCATAVERIGTRKGCSRRCSAVCSLSRRLRRRSTSPCGTCPRSPPPRSVATGTTRTTTALAPPSSRSATSPDTRATAPPRWRRSATCCVALPSTATTAPQCC
jgi:GAF domain-containing protein